MKNQNIEDLLPILKCVSCSSIEIVLDESDPSLWSDFDFDCYSKDLVCSSCGCRYPITNDGIPLLWTTQIKKLLGDKKHELKRSADNIALSSNIDSYNRISDDYSAHWRREDSLVKKMKEGVNRLFPANHQHADSGVQCDYHLDIGCGPGHVLEWLDNLGYKQIGLDVSLKNLRNARASTGAYVVLGDATNMPFRSNTFRLVTEASVLHHIYEWKDMIKESCRVCCNDSGGIFYDTEPTKESLDLSSVAKFVFDLRWPIYKIISFFDSRKNHFRNTAVAKDYYLNAEVHNQPGKGFDVSELKNVFIDHGFSPEIILSPNVFLVHRDKISIKDAGWKRIVLHALSGHNPLLAKYGGLTVLAKSTKGK